MSNDGLAAYCAKKNTTNNILKYCQNVKNIQKLVGYNKLVTGGNNPTISKAMRYSQYVQTNTGKLVTNGKPISAINQVAATFIGSISGNVLTITSMTSGAIGQYQLIKGEGVEYGTFIASFVTGTSGVGIYTVNIGQNVSSRNLSANIIPSTFNQAIPFAYGKGYYGALKNTQGIPNFPITTKAAPNCMPCVL